MILCFKRIFEKLDTTAVITVMTSDAFECGWLRIHCLQVRYTVGTLYFLREMLAVFHTLERSSV
jgi:hypothetical protein